MSLSSTLSAVPIAVLSSASCRSDTACSVRSHAIPPFRLGGATPNCAVRDCSRDDAKPTEGPGGRRGRTSPRWSRITHPREGHRTHPRGGPGAPPPGRSLTTGLVMGTSPSCGIHVGGESRFHAAAWSSVDPLKCDRTSPQERRRPRSADARPGSAPRRRGRPSHSVERGPIVALDRARCHGHLNTGISCTPSSPPAHRPRVRVAGEPGPRRPRRRGGGRRRRRRHADRAPARTRGQLLRGR